MTTAATKPINERIVRTAVSQIGRMLPNACISGKEILVAVRAFLDSSGKPHEGRVTLAAFSAPDALWGDMELAWRTILSDHPLKPKYIHMKELCHLRKEFDKAKGWTLEEAFGLVNKVLTFLQMLPKKDFNMFYCSIDLEARKRLISEGYPIPDPISICNGFCSEFIVRTYLQKELAKDPEVRYENIEGLHYYFDRGEDYFGPFRERWSAMLKKAQKDGSPNPWVAIHSVGISSMENVPGLQAADVLAWAINRGHTAKDGSPGKMHGWIMKQIIAGYRVEMDYDNLRKQFPKRMSRKA